MRYTIHEGPNAGKRINIPDAVIEQGLREDLTRAETIERYLSDEGFLENAVVAELTQKAKDNKAVNHDAGAKPKRKAPTRKPDEVKRAIVAAIAEFVEGIEGVDNVNITNVERMIAFAYAGDNFEVTLTKKRKPKE